MIYGQQHLEDGVVVGQTSKLEIRQTGHEPSLLTRVLARHHGNIVNIAQTLFRPGESREMHVNEDVDEILIVLNGEVDVTTGIETTALRAKDGGYIFLPHRVNHGLKNPGKDEAILLTIAIRHENYVHRNETLVE